MLKINKKLKNKNNMLADYTTTTTQHPYLGPSVLEGCFPLPVEC